MKEFALSTEKERIGSIAFSVCLIACFGVLLFSLRSNIGLLLACCVAIVPLSALLVYYVISVLKAVCIVDPAARTVEVRGARNFTVDVSKAVLLQTLAKKNGQTSIRVLVFTDEDLNVVSVIPTMFTYKQGILADPVARQIAEVLGIAFQANVPEWEYDKQKYQEHVKEEAIREKAEAKARREARMKHRIEKYRK